MSEEEVVNNEAQDQEEEASIEIDLNATLLEIMVKRTEILEKMIKGEISAEEASRMLNSVVMPAMARRRRRRA